MWEAEIPSALTEHRRPDYQIAQKREVRANAAIGMESPYTNVFRPGRSCVDHQRAIGGLAVTVIFVLC